MKVNKLSLARVEKGLTQEMVAKQCGCSVATISNIEAGRTQPRLKTAISLASLLGIALEDIIAFTQEGGAS